MPGYLTDYLNNRVLDNLFGSLGLTPPATLYFGLSRGSANKFGSINEPSGGSYARIPLPNSIENFPRATSGTKSNAAPIAFPTATADWGEIHSVFIADGPSGVGGVNILAMADLAQSRVIVSGSAPVSIAPGSLFLSHT
jgi:hypothetical protein